MSILQEYEKIKSYLKKGEFEAMERYLKINPHLSLSDLYYKKEEYNLFYDWWTLERQAFFNAFAEYEEEN